MRYQDIMRNRGYRDRQSRQFAQACLRPEVPEKCPEYLLNFEGTNVIIMDHAWKKIHNRMDFSNREGMGEYFTRIAAGLKGFTWKEYNQEVFVYSRSHRRGCIVAHRRDFRRPDDKSLAYVIVTVYPLGSSKPLKAGTEVIYAY